MARIRTIKHEFFTDDGVAELSPHARLTFIGLWTLADRSGRLKDSPKWLRAQLFPYEPKLDMEAILEELSVGRFIIRYQATGSWIQIRSFEKHQRPNIREPDSEIPPPPDADICAHVQAHAGFKLTDRSAARNGSGEGEGKGREGEGNGSVGLAPDEPPPVAQSKPPDTQARSLNAQVLEVFDHYRRYHPRAHPKPRPEGKEAKAIKARFVDGYSVADLCQAIDGYHRSPFHVGENERGQQYLQLELMVRDSDHVNAGIEHALKANGAGVVFSEKEKRTARGGEAWLAFHGHGGGGT